MMNFEVLQGDESLTCLTPSRFWNQSDKQSLLRCRKVKNHFFQKSTFFGKRSQNDQISEIGHQYGLPINKHCLQDQLD